MECAELSGLFATEAEEEYRKLGYWTDELLGDVASRHAVTHPDRLAVVDDQVRLTYGELEHRVAALAGGWQASGLSRGDRVILQLSNTAAFIEVFLSLQRVGAVPVMALPGHRLKDLRAFCTIAEPAAYIAEARGPGVDFGALATSLRHEFPRLRVVLRGEAGPHEKLDEIRHEQVLSALPRPLQATDLALLQLSGGSTGTPKLIPRTHADYLYSIRESARICELSPSTRYLCVLPAAHNFPLSSPGTLGTLHAGGTIVMAPNPSATTAFRLIEEERVTLSAVVPPIAILWLEAVAATRRDLSSLNMLQVGGAKLSASVARQIPTSLRCRLQQVFGMAEGLVNYTRPDDPDELVYTTQGRPISPHDELRIVDEHDRPVPHGMPGHLQTRGPYTIRGYYRDSEQNQRSFTSDGYYRTGDVVRLVGSHLEVMGRAKEQINRAGEKVSPSEVEDLLLTHPSVREVCVVGAPDPLLGEAIHAHVVAREGVPPLTAATLRLHLQTKGGATHQTPDQFHFCQELPRSIVGKTSSRELRSPTTPPL